MKSSHQQIFGSTISYKSWNVQLEAIDRFLLHNNFPTYILDCSDVDGT